ncbi:hypothetical protein BKA65DRAFT_95267 [Rhexocercosporidium sp. MPI-PUGE-AT-0058]|nr:hypothetical protein BKA65DRAFT_95267 [Rhexocercosporidium sp. MPI-PUGE-AT-0058]
MELWRGIGLRRAGSLQFSVQRGSNGRPRTLSQELSLRILHHASKCNNRPAWSVCLHIHERAAFHPFDDGVEARPSQRLPVFVLSLLLSHAPPGLFCIPGALNHLHPRLGSGRPFRTSCRSATPSRTGMGANKIRRLGCCPPDSSYQKHFIPDVNPTGLDNWTRLDSAGEMWRQLMLNK